MILRKLCLLILFCCVVVSNGQDKPRGEDPAAKWEDTIRQLEVLDRFLRFGGNDGRLLL